MHRSLCLLPVILLLFSIAGCSDGPIATPQAIPLPEPKVSTTAPQNVLFIILDAFDASHLTHLGYKDGITPNLDRLASEGVTFANAHSQTSSTNSSTKSFLTGMYPSALMVGHKFHAMKDGDYTMAEFFRDAGFRTAGFSENPFISKTLGFTQGFDNFEYVNSLHPRDEELGYAPRDHDSTLRLFNVAREWVRAQAADDRWFCYVHILRPHNPYTVPESFAKQVKFTPTGLSIDRRENSLIIGALTPPKGHVIEMTKLYIDRYDTNIRYVDSLLGAFLEGLEAESLLEDTVLIVSSDHGEAFWQHDKFGHNTTVYEEMIHVPLIFHAPESLGFVSRTVAKPVELVDLFSTLAELFSLAPPQSLHGTSFLPLLLGRPNRDKDAFYSMTNEGEFLAVRKGDLKLILERRAFSHFVPTELFDISKDPGEQNNLLGTRHPGAELMDLVELYREKYFVRAYDKAPEFSQAELDTLESLGYTN